MNGTLVHWIISGFLFLWGLAYAGLVTFAFGLATPEHWQNLVAEGRITADYAAYIDRIPGWVVAITIAAAATRFLGGLSLLLNRAWALPLYAVSLGLVVVIMFRGFVLADVASVIRRSQMILEIVFLLLSVFAVWYAWRQVLSGVLR